MLHAKDLAIIFAYDIYTEFAEGGIESLLIYRPLITDWIESNREKNTIFLTNAERGYRTKSELLLEGVLKYKID